MKSFKLFFENLEKTAVFTYGRMNPPTIGHQKVIDKVKSVAREEGGIGYIIPTHTTDNKKNPLIFDEKKQVLSYMVDGLTILDAGKTLLHSLQYLQSHGYKKIIQIAGKDRLEEFNSFRDQYNNKPDKSGKIPFSFDSYTIISSGERDPDSEGIEGVSASKVRNYAITGEYEMFARNISKNVPDEVKRVIFSKIQERIK